MLTQKAYSLYCTYTVPTLFYGSLAICVVDLSVIKNCKNCSESLCQMLGQIRIHSFLAVKVFL